ncbi:MAG: hypothetical protein WD847_05235 [Pirellulales bacterium]
MLIRAGSPGPHRFAAGAALLLAFVAGGLAGCRQHAPSPSAGPVGGPSARQRISESAAQVASGATRKIELDDVEVGDDDLKALGDMPALVELRLPKSRITDRGLAHLAALVELERLVLGETTVTDAGLQRLGKLSRLKTINFQTSHVTDEGLAHLAPLADLELLRLGSSRIRGPGLAHLRKLPRLKFLILNSAPLDDAGLAHLAGWQQLESLYVERTKVTDQGASELLDSCPKLHLHW